MQKGVVNNPLSVMHSTTGLNSHGRKVNKYCDGNVTVEMKKPFLPASVHFRHCTHNDNTLFIWGKENPLQRLSYLESINLEDHFPALTSVTPLSKVLSRLTCSNLLHMIGQGQKVLSCTEKTLDLKQCQEIQEHDQTSNPGRMPIYLME